MLTDYALELLRKHEKKIAEERKQMDLNLLRNNIKQGLMKDLVEPKSNVIADELPLKFSSDVKKEEPAEPKVVCDAPDSDLIAFNSNVLTIGG